MNLFSTIVYTEKVSNEQVIQKELLDTFHKLTFEHNPDWDSNTHLLSDYKFESNLFDKYKCDKFLLELKKHVYMYLDIVNYKEIKNCKMVVEQSWMTLNKTGMFSHPHDHGSFDISGVYYISTTGEDGDLYFMNPNKMMKCSRVTESYEQMHYFKPETGRLFLFPSWLDHGVSENKTSSDRISLSFNINISPFSSVGRASH